MTDDVRRLAADVARGLRASPKRLDAHYLYDALGSALFEAICRLPWYRITRAETRLLAAHAREIAARAGEGRLRIAELGVGSGEKLIAVVDAIGPERLAGVHLIDVSPEALEAAAVRLSARGVRPDLYQATYHDGLAALTQNGAGGATLALFLGSNIGNYGQAEGGALLAGIRGALRRGDTLLLGADLVKPAADLMLAYDDPLGVTAAFNRNLLVRLNRQLGADFDVTRFDHRAVWNEGASRVEMHLVSRGRQDVSIPGAGLAIPFEPGESIWTESSYKYTEQGIRELGASAGFAVEQQWLDLDARFALTLFTLG